MQHIDNGEKQFVFIQAPAGYGKTVLAELWLARHNMKKEAVSLDVFDNKLMSFCGRFCAALCDCQPDNKALEKIAGHPAFSTAPDEFSLRAIGALDVEVPCRIAIDDLHEITNPGVLYFIFIALKRLPKNITVMLLSRDALPPGGSEFVVKNEIHLVDAEQLRFKKEEIRELFGNWGFPLAEEKLKDVYESTGGWAIGLNAVLLSGAALGNEMVVSRLDDYLKIQVWDRWDADIREFMVQSQKLWDLR